MLIIQHYVLIVINLFMVGQFIDNSSQFSKCLVNIFLLKLWKSVGNGAKNY